MTTARVDRRAQRSPARSGATGTVDRTDALALRRRQRRKSRLTALKTARRLWPSTPSGTTVSIESPEVTRATRSSGESARM